MSTKRKICVVTGTRAEYGLMYWLMKELDADPNIEFQLLVTGTHLSSEFGLTYRDIEADGFRINEKVEMLLSSDTPVGISKSMGLGMVGMADALDRLAPDIMVFLGDRFEIMAAAQVAMVAGIPMAHISGGEATEGLIDESIRHSLTKMSHLHFTAAKKYSKRVIQLGESPERVFNVGAPGIDNLSLLDLLDRDQVEAEIGLKVGDKPLVLCTYHPETLKIGQAEHGISELLSALDKFPEARIVFTKSNADTGGRVINQVIDDYVANNSGRAAAFVNLGQIRYLSVLCEADVVVGNSSSGIVEAPAAKTITVNIGDRQRGRMKAPSIIDCGKSADEISGAMTRALSSEYQDIASRGESLFGQGGVAKRIKDIICETPLEGILIKSFYDLDV